MKLWFDPRNDVDALYHQLLGSVTARGFVPLGVQLPGIGMRS